MTAVSIALRPLLEWCICDIRITLMKISIYNDTGLGSEPKPVFSIMPELLWEGEILLRAPGAIAAIIVIGLDPPAVVATAQRDTCGCDGTGSAAAN